MAHQRFITKGDKKIPISDHKAKNGFSSKDLGIDGVKTKKLSSLSIVQLKKKLAPNGKFTGYNVKLRANESVPLESVGKAKNGSFILKGTSPSNHITVVRFASSKK